MSVLKDAFQEAARREFEDVPEENELDWVFSERFQKQMDILISGQTVKRCFFAEHRDAPNKKNGVSIVNLAEHDRKKIKNDFPQT